MLSPSLVIVEQILPKDFPRRFSYARSILARDERGGSGFDGGRGGEEEKGDVVDGGETVLVCYGGELAVVGRVEGDEGASSGRVRRRQLA